MACDGCGTSRLMCIDSAGKIEDDGLFEMLNDWCMGNNVVRLNRCGTSRSALFFCFRCVVNRKTKAKYRRIKEIPQGGLFASQYTSNVNGIRNELDVVVNPLVLHQFSASFEAFVILVRIVKAIVLHPSHRSITRT